MKVVLVNPRDPGHERIQRKWKAYPPLGLLYLATALEAAGHSVEVLDAGAFDLEQEEVVRRCARAQPGLVGLPVLAQTARQVRGLAFDLRARLPETPIVLGGVEASACPDRMLEEIPPADFVLRGDAERPIAALCAALEGQARLDAVPALSRRVDGAVVHNPHDPQARPASAWLPAKHLVDRAYLEGRYFTLLVRERPVDSILTSRGCPCRCRFCYNAPPRHLVRSAEDVVQEIALAHGRGIRHVELVDDNFTLNRDRAVRILEQLARADLGVRLVLKSRPERVDQEILRLARRAGVYQVSYGMESGVQRVLDAMGRGHTVADTVRACELTKAAGLACHGSWFFGFPGETPDTIRETTSLIVRIKPTTAALGVLRPYAGTSVYEQAKANGTLVGDWSALRDDMPWIRLPWTERRQDLETLVFRAKRRIYLRPHYLVGLGGWALRDRNTFMARYALLEALAVMRE